MSRLASTPEASIRNPEWTADEHILALDLYMRHRGRLLDDKHPDVVDLSIFLREMAKRNGVAGNASFRNANGIAMKLANFSRLDPVMQERGLKGLPAGSKGEEVVWAEFQGSPDRLRAIATAIRSAATEGDPTSHGDRPDTDDPYESEADEGRLLSRLHRTRERSRKIVKQKKDQVLRQFGQLKCEACGFSFAECYGTHGENFIEVHHTRPLHTLRIGEKTKLSDLAVVCANCHRMIHAKRRWLTMDELRNLIRRHSLHPQHDSEPDNSRRGG